MATVQPVELHSAARIVRDRRMLGGEPTVRGTRISVRSVVLAAREYGGVAGVLRAYPQLDPEAARAALTFYEAHAEEIDGYIWENTGEP